VILTALAAASLAAWGWLLFLRGGFWRADQHLPRAERLEDWPKVVAVVPARNEAAFVGRAVASLLAQHYRGRLRVVVVDDASDDGTADAARAGARPGQASRLAVVAATPRPEGWVGKVWAMAEGVRHAASLAPEMRYVWFTDADIVHAPETLSRLVAMAEPGRIDLVSLMVRLHCRGAWERLLIPAFVFFFQMLYPFRWSNDPARQTAAAAGGSMLVRRTALERIGGMAAIRGALIDDCALARTIKRSGGQSWLGLSLADSSIRPYAGLGEIWATVARTAFDHLRYSALALTGTVAGLALVFVVPPLATNFAPWPANLIGAFAWAAMALAEAPALALYRQPRWLGLLLPVAALLYVGMTLDSARRHWQGAGGAWKGRTHRPAAERP
jgi:hopene-associated glycosyltransferase HpnB